MPRALLLWGPVLLVAAGVATFSHLSQPPRPLPVPDWGLHSLEFSVLAFLLVRALGGGLQRRVRVVTGVVAVALAAAYGTLDEIHQSFVPGRDASSRDVVADTAGATTGAALALATTRLLARRRGHRTGGVRPLFVELVTGSGCPLCDEARGVLAHLGERLPLQVSEVSIDDAPDLAARFGQEIPVVRVDGRKLSKGKVHEVRLAGSLQACLDRRVT